MRKIIVIGFLFSACYGFSGCNPFYGIIYENYTRPFGAAKGAKPLKEGRASCVNYLWLVAIGDCSIKAAKKDGGITAVSSVDIQRTNRLFIIVKETTIVRGE
jgi:hypothetical protein